MSTIAGNVEAAADLLQDALADTDARIQARFNLEKAQGTLPADFPSADQARLLFDLRQGLVFRARAGFEDVDLLRGIETAVTAVLAPAG